MAVMAAKLIHNKLYAKQPPTYCSNIRHPSRRKSSIGWIQGSRVELLLLLHIKRGVDWADVVTVKRRKMRLLGLSLSRKVHNFAQGSS